jgi:hypothetical protein
MPVQAERFAIYRLCASEHTRGAHARIIRDMKRPEAPTQAALQDEIAALAQWLAGSRDRLYWRYGYFAGLQQALTLFADRAATLH